MAEVVEKGEHLEEDNERKSSAKKRTPPKTATLPNGTTFTARYERISRKRLPRNIHVKMLEQ